MYYIRNEGGNLFLTYRCNTVFKRMVPTYDLSPKPLILVNYSLRRP